MNRSAASPRFAAARARRRRGRFGEFRIVRSREISRSRRFSLSNCSGSGAAVSSAPAPVDSGEDAEGAEDAGRGAGGGAGAGVGVAAGGSAAGTETGGETGAGASASGRSAKNAATTAIVAPPATRKGIPTLAGVLDVWRVGGSGIATAARARSRGRVATASPRVIALTASANAITVG